MMGPGSRREHLPARFLLVLNYRKGKYQHDKHE